MLRISLRFQTADYSDLGVEKPQMPADRLPANEEAIGDDLILVVGAYQLENLGLSPGQLRGCRLCDLAPGQMRQDGARIPELPKLDCLEGSLEDLVRGLRGEHTGAVGCDCEFIDSGGV